MKIKSAKCKKCVQKYGEGIPEGSDLVVKVVSKPKNPLERRRIERLAGRKDLRSIINWNCKYTCYFRVYL